MPEKRTVWFLVTIEAAYCAVGQPLPPQSKMTVIANSLEEADRYGGTGSKNADGTLHVDLCLSCQITRSSTMTKMRSRGRCNGDPRGSFIEKEKQIYKYTIVFVDKSTKRIVTRIRRFGSKC